MNNLYSYFIFQILINDSQFCSRYLIERVNIIMAVNDDIKLWIRPEVMEMGVLSILPPEKISVEVSLLTLNNFFSFNK